MTTVLTTPHGTHVDDHDLGIMRERLAALDARAGIRCGDYVRFPDGHLERVSYLWDDGPQTSTGGSWYLGHGYCDFSGGLNGVVKSETLTLTDETMMGTVWFFHHDYAQAHNGVDVTVPFRVYETTYPRQLGQWR